MHVMGRIGFMGLGIALAGYLSGAPVLAADKSTRGRVKDYDYVSQERGQGQ